MMVAPWHTDAVDERVRAYIDEIPADRRPLFYRLHRLILEAYPDVTVLLSYKMPTYRRGRQRLFLGVWQHGVSVYGWDEGRDAGFIARHPGLKTSTGTIRLRPSDAAGITDDDLRDLVHAALGPREEES